VIDTHAHIYLEHFDEDRPQILSQAKEIGLTHILLPNIDASTISSMNQLCNESSMCLPMMGLHPCSVKEDYLDELKIVERELAKGGYIAVGEMGTDLYWDKTFWKEQQEAFNIQCEWALHNDLPIVIHCRESIDETIRLVAPWARKGVSGVFHCFSGNGEQARQMIDLGFYLGIGGVSTFKNGGLDKVLPDIDRSRIVLETDSPYLAPVPHRGKRNEPAYTLLVAQRLAEFWQMDVNEVDSITSNNATQLFRLNEL
jgi:TatD DNase family protein